MPPHRHRCRGPGPCLCAEFFQVRLLGSSISTLLIGRVQDPRPEARMGVCICGDDFDAHEPVVILDLPPRVTSGGLSGLPGRTRRSPRLNETATATAVSSSEPVSLHEPVGPIPLRFQPVAYMSINTPNVNRNVFTDWRVDFKRIAVMDNLADSEEFMLRALDVQTGALWMFRILHALANKRDVPFPDDNSSPFAEVLIKNSNMKALHSSLTNIQMYVIISTYEDDSMLIFDVCIF